ncbi:hypothetical protein ACT80S_05475 [Ramlibacter sp. MAHUQ-53]|uniref:hypothetical protein n=1 Tax=unclassified Ramlibacter TaxID=2617605 RepID=UPI003629C3CF
MWSKLIMAVAWPAFLAACLLEAAVFAVVDPLDLSWAGDPLGWSRQAVYTVGFFVFWAACIASSVTALTLVSHDTHGPAHAHE